MDAEKSLGAVTVVGDKIIADILAQDGAVVYPAYSCRYDGFVNDVFTEYTNPSVYRPLSVQDAALQSELSVNFSGHADIRGASHPLAGQNLLYYGQAGERLFTEPGEFYIGWTMYDKAGADENLTVWVGANKVAYVRSDDDDNRVHLYVLDKPFFVDTGERVRLVTDANGGQYRIENIVLLPKLPEPRRTVLKIGSITAEILDGVAGSPKVRLNWRTARPSRSRVSFGDGEGLIGVVDDDTLLANHCVDLAGAGRSKPTWFEISAVAASGDKVETGRLLLKDYEPPTDGDMQAGRIPFTVHNPVDEPVTGWPVTWGLPIPRGCIWDLDHCRLVDAKGARVPSQKRVEVTWDDGSIRWALFDFTLDLTADGTANLVMEYGPEVSDAAVGRGLIVDTTPEGITVDAGLLRLTFSASDYSFPAKVEVRRGEAWVPAVGDQDGHGAVALTDGDGQAYSWYGDVDDIVLEESGDLRAVVRLSAKHRATNGEALFRSVIRVTAYYGKPFVRVQHTFENDNVEDVFTRIRTLSLGVNLESDWLSQVRLDGDVLDPNAGPVALRQPLDDRFTVSQGGRVLKEGEHAANWLALSGGAGTMATGMRGFWENYPKGWRVTEQGLSIDICPDVSDMTYPRGDVEEVRSAFYLQDGGYKFKCGMARTHDMIFAFGESLGQVLSDVQHFSNPPLVRVDPGLLAETGVLSAMSTRGEQGAEQYDEHTVALTELFDQNRVDVHAYGMMNYGDWWGERRYNWGDMEYDTPYGMLLEYLRGGSERCFTLGWQAAWHLADVDTCHYHVDARPAGRQYLHSLGHVGDYYPDGYLPGAIAHQAMSWTHTWIEGLFLYALLTGERRLWDVANRTVEILAGADLNDYDFTNCRDCGWPLRHLIGAYQATGRALYLNGASIIVERVLERQRDSGGWDRLMVPGHCFHIPPRHMGNAGFMIGILLAALKRYHEETNDEAVAKAIIGGANYLVNVMWVEETSLFRYTTCPQSIPSEALNTQVLEGIGYAWRLSRDANLRQALVAGTQACLDNPEGRISPPVGKDISTRLRSLPFIMYDMVRASRE